ISQREASAEEKRLLARLGRVSETIRMRAMARRIGGVGPTGASGPEAVLSEIKGVDRAYPLYGKLVSSRGASAAELAASDILVDRALAGRLALRIGDRLRYGEAEFRIRDLIVKEPDRVGEGFTLGAVAIVSLEGLRRTQLFQPGSLLESKYRVALPPGTDAAKVAKDLVKRFSSSGWEVKDRDRAAPGANRFFERMGQFLALIGLVALIVAGIGVSNGVSSYLALKRSGIATLKVLGAASGDIARIYVLQIGAVVGVAVGCGLVAGALLPVSLIALTRDLLPVEAKAGLHPGALATSAAHGVLIALIFTLPPLARARLLPAAALFRTIVERRTAIDRRSVLIIAAAGLAVVLLAMLTARQPLFALAVLGATGGVLLLLMLIGWALKRIAARLPRPRRPLLRLVLANFHRPGAQTVPLVIALGLGLTLFVTLAAIQTSLDAEISRSVPKRAPNQFVLDIPMGEQARFEAVVRGQAPEAKLNLVPSLRGLIVAYGNQRVAELEEIPQGAWFLRGERGLTYSEALPEGSDLVAGEWWAKDYAGPPLLSLDEEAARIMGIGVGDTLTVSVLGREMEARIASLRRINWDTLGFNYIMVFSPNALRNVPHNLTSTITMDAAHAPAVARALLGSFASISLIEVGELIEQVRTLLGQMAVAIDLAGSVTILAGIAVLIGAIAAARQARSYDSVVLKTLGATRGQILAAQVLEYALLAAVLAVIALALGSAAAWYVIVELFEFGWAPDWRIVLATLGAGGLVTLGIGVAGSIPIISVRPAAALRQLEYS
ncbi:MAG: transporter permease, partial [Alphaproteobacteria bacterium]|nr:transporter permease [Alphaproteobacteria bacterium]